MYIFQAQNDLMRIRDATTIKTKDQVLQEKKLQEEQKEAAAAKAKAKAAKAKARPQGPATQGLQGHPMDRGGNGPPPNSYTPTGGWPKVSGVEAQNKSIK